MNVTRPVTRPAARTWRCAPAATGAAGFHAGLPGYAPTPLIELPALAAELGVGRVFVKDESARLGLPAFKVLGASWAIHRALSRAPRGPKVLVTATDGNHGRAVARMGARIGHAVLVFTAEGVHPAAVAAIAAEGAEVSVVAGSYDEAVRRAAKAAEAPAHLLVQDTAWPGYEDVPRWIVEGYGTLFGEIDRQLGRAGAEPPDLIAIPVGVGSLLQAGVVHYRSGHHGPATAVMSVEPESAACVLASLVRGSLVTVPTGTTIMAGLNCGTPSSLAWPYLRDGLDAAVAVTDAAAAGAAADLAALGVSAGPCGAAALAGARAALTGAQRESLRDALAVSRDSAVVLVSTEGAAANPNTAPAEDAGAGVTAGAGPVGGTAGGGGSSERPEGDVGSNADISGGGRPLGLLGRVAVGDSGGAAAAGPDWLTGRGPSRS